MGDISVNFDVATDILVDLNEAVDIAMNIPSDVRGGDVIANGNFDSDTVWVKTANWSITGGKAVAAGATGALTQAGILIVGESYEITYTVSDYSAFAVRAFCGGTVGASRSANGTYTETLVCTVAGDFAFDGAGAFAGKIDNVRAYPV